MNSSDLLNLLRALAGNPHDCCWSHLPTVSSSSSSSSEEIFACAWITEPYILDYPACPEPLWVRPDEWPTMPTYTPGDQKIVGLVAVEDTWSELLAIRCEGAYTVDWGDGTAPEDVASGVKAEHQYDYATLAGSPLSYGYKTVLVTVIPQEGQNLTLVDFQQKHSSSGSAFSMANWLELESDIPNCTSLVVGSDYAWSRTAVSLGRLQQFTLHGHSLTSTDSLFEGCYALSSVPLFDTANITSMYGMFTNCYALTVSPLFVTSAATDLSYMFFGCHSLICVPPFDTALTTTMASMFEQCHVLPAIPLLNTASLISASYWCSECEALSTVPELTTSALEEADGMFWGCASLTTIPLFDTSKAWTTSSMFSLCHALSEVPAFSLVSAYYIGYMFESCVSIASLPALNLDGADAGTSNTSSFAYTYAVTRSQVTGQHYRLRYIDQPLTAEALNEIFTLLGTTTGQTLYITGCLGAATCDRSIATAKGWTISG